MICFTVPAVPIAQPRQRHRVVAAKGRTFVSNYTSRTDPVNDFKATVRMAAREAYRGAPLEGPLYLGLVFVMPRPGRLRWKKRPMPREPHAQKPDDDNLRKSVKDALRGLVYVDDAQVAATKSEKWFAAGDEQPHVEVVVVPMVADWPEIEKTLARER